MQYIKLLLLQNLQNSELIDTPNNRQYRVHLKMAESAVSDKAQLDLALWPQQLTLALWLEIFLILADNP